MAYFMFVDESGQDHRQSPYEVLAGVAIHDAVLWHLICKNKDVEVATFGTSYPRGESHELRAKHLLNRKAFRLAGQGSAIEPRRRADLARAILVNGEQPTKDHLTALGQAKIAFVEQVLDLAQIYGVRAFASIVDPMAPRPPAGDYLRKDYSYLFQRFYYVVESKAEHERGVVVFDEIERSRSHVLLEQMSAYFLRTRVGQERSTRVVPEPFFVHSDLTTGILIADLVAYIVSFNVRFGRMKVSRREELDDVGSKVWQLRSQPVELAGGHSLSAFTFITDLRAQNQRNRDAVDGD